MAKKSVNPAITRAHALMDWFATLDLPNRTSNALRRDLEVTLGIRVGKEGSGTLASMDQAQFAEELYRANGGNIRNIPGIADTAISALRAVIPPPAGMPDPTADDFTLPPLDEEEPAAAEIPDPPMLDDDAALHPAVHFGEDPEDEANADDLAELAQLEAAPTATTAPNRRVPRRRGRPRRIPTPIEPEPSLQAELVAPVNGTPIASIAPEPIRIEAPPLPPINDQIVTISEETRLLQLWSALHPQGRRATLGFIATLVAEEV